MAATSRDWKRLAAKVQARIDEMGQTRNQLQAQSGTAIQTWDKVLRGQPIERVDAISRMEDHLGWAKGTMMRVVREPDFVPLVNEVLTQEAPDITTTVLGLIHQIQQEQAELSRRLDEIAQAVGLPLPPKEP